MTASASTSGPAAIGRREFLTGIAAAGVACAATGLSTELGAQAGPAASGRMFIALNGSITGKKVAWPEFVRLAAQVGYGGADISLDPAMKEGAEATKALFAELKIRPASMSLPVRFNGADELFQEGFARLPDVARFAAAIDCPRIMAVMPPASPTPKDAFRAIVKERVTRIGDVLARSNVRLGLEFLGPLHFRTSQPHEFIWQMNELVAFAKACGPNVGLTLDAWHWHHSGATEADILAAGKSRIVHVHVSDAAKQPPEEVRDNRRLMPGEGVIDLMTFFGALKKVGYTESVSVEPIGRVPEEMSAEEGARLALDTTTAVMKKAGVLDDRALAIAARAAAEHWNALRELAR